VLFEDQLPSDLKPVFLRLFLINDDSNLLTDELLVALFGNGIDSFKIQVQTIGRPCGHEKKVFDMFECSRNLTHEQFSVIFYIMYAARILISDGKLEQADGIKHRLVQRLEIPEKSNRYGFEEFQNTLPYFESLFNDESGLDVSVCHSKFRTHLSDCDQTILDDDAIPLEETVVNPKSKCWRFRLKFQRHRVAILWIAIWVAVTLGLFLWKFLYYRFDRPVEFETMGYCICFARGSAEALKFNITLVLLTMCRSVISSLRDLGYGALLRVIPLDEALFSHKVIGIVILGFVLTHSFAHVCDFYYISKSDFLSIRLMFGDTFASVPTQGELWLTLPAVTGWIMLSFMFIAYGFIPFRRQQFVKFWLTHQLLILIVIIVTFHGALGLLEPPTAYAYVLVPLVLYILDRLCRALLTRYLSLMKTSVLEANCGENVLELKLLRPRTFDFVAGAYAFVKIPQVSAFEWHPFTISSHPGNDYIRFHIKKVGDWTSAALCLFQEPLNNKEEDAEEASPLVFPEVRVYGPFGAPSQSWLHSDICVFIATGVGITPYLSIIGHILNTVQEYRCIDCGSYSNAERARKSRSLPSKVFLIWSSRDIGEFSWADDLIEQIIQIDQTGFITSDHYLTKKSVSMSDSFKPTSNFHTLHYGRPDYTQILRRIRESCRSGLEMQTCGVFATVPALLDKTLQKITVDESESDWVFEYKAENF